MRNPSFIALFDIDGTLVSTGGAGRRAMVQAFEQVTGLKEPMDFPFAGMTDLGILGEAFRRAGRTFDQALMAELEAVYLPLLVDEVTRSEGYRVMPGVSEAIERAEARGVVGLGTGNLERAARIKLGRAELAERFGFGGFGSDHVERAEVIRRGIERGAARLGVEVASCEALIIGDTPLDVEAAHANGARCLAVATGVASAEALAAAGADLVVPDLTTPEALAFIGS